MEGKLLYVEILSLQYCAYVIQYFALNMKDLSDKDIKKSLDKFSRTLRSLH